MHLQNLLLPVHAKSADELGVLFRREVPNGVYPAKATSKLSHWYRKGVELQQDIDAVSYNIQRFEGELNRAVVTLGQQEDALRLTKEKAEANQQAFPGNVSEQIAENKDNMIRQTRHIGETKEVVNNIVQDLFWERRELEQARLNLRKAADVIDELSDLESQ